jgi:hypothetical protein
MATSLIRPWREIWGLMRRITNIAQDEKWRCRGAGAAIFFQSNAISGPAH